MHSWPLPAGVSGFAMFDSTGEYRYWLSRQWDEGFGIVSFVGLNPSTAESDVDDPTVRKCYTWARKWGFEKMVMLNLYAYRATSPEEMHKAADPIGPDNDDVLHQAATESNMIVAAWGAGASKERADQVLPLIRSSVSDLVCMGLNQDGSPKHPLYLAAKTQPVVFP